MIRNSSPVVGDGEYIDVIDGRSTGFTRWRDILGQQTFAQVSLGLEDQRGIQIFQSSDIVEEAWK